MQRCSRDVAFLVPDNKIGCAWFFTQQIEVGVVKNHKVGHVGVAYSNTSNGSLEPVDP